MATIRTDGDELESLAAALEKMGRTAVKRIVEAGAKAAETREAEAVRLAGHDRPGKSRRSTGELMASIGHTDIREYLGGAATDVYPQGNDRRGERLATIAYVINYGRGGAKKGGMGDRFITRAEEEMEAVALDAMQAESDLIVQETNG